MYKQSAGLSPNRQHEHWLTRPLYTQPKKTTNEWMKKKMEIKLSGPLVLLSSWILSLTLFNRHLKSVVDGKCVSAKRILLNESVIKTPPREELAQPAKTIDFVSRVLEIENLSKDRLKTRPMKIRINVIACLFECWLLTSFSNCQTIGAGLRLSMTN